MKNKEVQHIYSDDEIPVAVQKVTMMKFVVLLFKSNHEILSVATHDS